MKKNVKPKKKIGQHFLADDNISKKIIGLVDFKSHKQIIEVGPGMGALTDYLIDSAKNLSLIEIDNECIEYLEKKYQNKNLEKDPIEWAYKTIWFGRYSTQYKFHPEFLDEIKNKIEVSSNS